MVWQGSAKVHGKGRKQTALRITREQSMKPHGFPDLNRAEEPVCNQQHYNIHSRSPKAPILLPKLSQKSRSCRRKCSSWSWPGSPLRCLLLPTSTRDLSVMVELEITFPGLPILLCHAARRVFNVPFFFSFILCRLSCGLIQPLNCLQVKWLCSMNKVQLSANTQGTKNTVSMPRRNFYISVQSSSVETKQTWNSVTVNHSETKGWTTALIHISKCNTLLASESTEWSKESQVVNNLVQKISKWQINNKYR